jgi:branched-chain amino acid aminotransferase
MKNSVVWFDGNFLPFHACLISPMTHSLCHGTSVYEGIRCYNGKIFKLDDHIQRLLKSCSIFKFSLNHSSEKIIEAIHALLQLNKHHNCYIKIIVFLDDADPSFMARNCITKIYITSFPFHYITPEGGVSLQISSWKKPSKYCHPYSAKTASTYSLSYLAFKEKDPKYNDVLFVSENGFICEASGANIFFYDGDELITPKEDMCLAGITRSVVINEISKIMNMRVSIREIHEKELNKFESAFLCGTAVEITHINSINNIEYIKSNTIKKIKEIYNNIVNNLT